MTFLLFVDEDGAPIVIVDSIAKKYSRSMIAVYDVSFTCKEGECFGLLGVNGAGKTTTFSILSGIIPPTQGNAFIKSYSLEQNKQKVLNCVFFNIFNISNYIFTPYLFFPFFFFFTVLILYGLLSSVFFSDW